MAFYWSHPDYIIHIDDYIHNYKNANTNKKYIMTTIKDENNFIVVDS